MAATANAREVIGEATLGELESTLRGRLIRHPTRTTTRPGWCGTPPTTVVRRWLEKSVSWTGRERLRCLWYRLRLTVQEMNYAARRIVELQMRLP